MKRNFLVLCLLVAALNALAYPFDVIITKSREQVQCIILSRTEELITYQHVGDESQTFTLNTSEVEKIYTRDNGQVISYVPETKLAAPASKKEETLIAEKPKPVEEKQPEPVAEKKVEQKEPIIEVAKEPEPVVEETKVVEASQPEKKSASKKKFKPSTEDEMKFKLFMSSLNGPDMEQYRAEKAEKAEREEVLNQNIISIFVTGLEDNQADIQQVMESEALAKLNALKDHKAKVEVVSKDITEDSIITIAKEHLSKYAFTVNVRPFQTQYYLQSRLIDATNGKLLSSASAASSLTSLEELLGTMDKFINQVNEHFQKKEEKAKEEEDAELKAWIEECDRQAAQPKEIKTSIYDDTFTLEIVNMHNYHSRVVVAGRLVGLANPWSTQRFKVSLDLYGKVQIIQNEGYQYYPAESIFYIPQQSSNGVLTLTME